jgi:hypothetical protein
MRPALGRTQGTSGKESVRALQRWSRSFCAADILCDRKRPISVPKRISLHYGRFRFHAAAGGGLDRRSPGQRHDPIGSRQALGRLGGDLAARCGGATSAATGANCPDRSCQRGAKGIHPHWGPSFCDRRHNRHDSSHRSTSGTANSAIRVIYPGPGASGSDPNRRCRQASGGGGTITGGGPWNATNGRFRISARNHIAGEGSESPDSARASSRGCPLCSHDASRRHD